LDLSWDLLMRKEYWTTQIFYHKRPRQGHCLELDFDDKAEAIRNALSWRELGLKVKINAGTDLPLFFNDPRDAVLEEVEDLPAPTPVKRGRKPKYL
jgi:hypothetical protein